jgi:hypothetical protein
MPVSCQTRRSPVPSQRHPRLQPRRDLPGGHPRGQQQAGQRVTRLHWLLPGSVPVQRQEDLPGREPRCQLVRGVDRERGLADPGHSPDRMNTDHPARTCRNTRQLLQLLLAPGERGDIAGQRARRRRSRASSSSARHSAAPRGPLEPGPDRAGQGQPYQKTCSAYP